MIKSKLKFSGTAPGSLYLGCVLSFTIFHTPIEPKTHESNCLLDVRAAFIYTYIYIYNSVPEHIAPADDHLSNPTEQNEQTAKLSNNINFFINPLLRKFIYFL